MTTAYLYKWTHIPSGMWYIGSKSAKNCHPDNHEKYICSKSSVKTSIKENRQDWYYDIIETGEPRYIRKRETEILVSLDAKNNPMSFNAGNAAWDPGNRLGRKESVITRERKSLARRGEKNPMYGKRGLESPHYGKKHTDEVKMKQSLSLIEYNRNRPESHNNNISKSLKGNAKLIERMQGENNPMYGKPCTEFNKQMTKLKNSGDGNPMKQPWNQLTCEHCNKTIAKNHYTMYHGDRCKNFTSYGSDVDQV